MEQKRQFDSAGRRERRQNQIESVLPENLDPSSMGRNTPAGKPIKKQVIANPPTNYRDPCLRIVVRKRLPAACERIADGVDVNRIRFVGINRAPGREYVNIPTVFRQILCE